MKKLFYLVPAQAEETGYETYKQALADLDRRKAMNRGTEFFVVRVLAHAKLRTVHETEEFPSADPRLPPRKSS